jgi:adenylate cyclase
MEKAASLNPSASIVLAGLTQPYLYLGKLDEVFDLIKRVEAIDPLHDRVLTWAKAWAYWQSGNCEEALKAMQSMSEQPVESFKLLSVIHTCLGNRSRAKELLAAYLEKSPGWSIAREYELNARNWTAEGALDRWLENLRSAGMPES